jgi:DNA primase
VFRSKLSQIERDDIVQLASETIFEDSRDASDARKYLFDQREISRDTVTDFQIGYVPMRASHDLSGRIVFPIKDMHGRNVALTSRLIAGGSGLRKHWHESFPKNKYIYGVNENFSNILRRRKVVIVEGQFDALRLRSAGIPIAIATLGSAISIYQLSRLLQIADDIFLCFDSDDAGRNATSQVFSLLKKYQLWRQRDVNVINISIGGGVKDPDEYISKYGKDEFINRLKESKEKYELRHRKNEPGSIFDF